MSLPAPQPTSAPAPSCNGRSPRTQRACSTMREPRDAVNGQRPPKHPANRSTISSTLHAAHPRHAATVSGKRSTRAESRNGHVSEPSDTTAASPCGEAPLRGYTGPTPKSLDGVRAAFFDTKGLSLESIREWESHCLHADMEVLGTASRNKRIAGTVTGYDDADGFTGTATTRGTLSLWLLSQAKFNGLKVLALWARLG